MVFSAGSLEDLERKVCLECHRQFTGIVAACPHDNSLLVPVAQDPLIGTKLAGKYEILSVLGTGGMGVVYKGRQDLMDRIVAIKMLQAHHLHDSMSVKRFQQEGRATCKLNHPHVITVYDFGLSPTGQPYIVMDFLDGLPLSELIKKEGQVGVERAIHIFKEACDGLAHAHNQGVIHRDLKPSNIVLINYDGDKDYVKVVDFGVAKIMEEGGTDGQKLTQMGEVCGSPVYMSPEQCQGLDLDRRSDVYSMGIVMYETLTNRLPILGKTMVETMAKHINDLPQPFSEARPDLYIPERVEQVIFKALAKRPEDRHQSMEQLLMELEIAIPKPGRSQVLRTTPLEQEGEEKKAEGGSFLENMTPARWGIAAAVVLLLVAVGIGGVAMLSGGQAQKAAKPAPAAEPAAKAGTEGNTTTDGKTASGAKPAALPGKGKTAATAAAEKNNGDEAEKAAETTETAKATEQPAAQAQAQLPPVHAKPKPKPKPKDPVKKIISQRRAYSTAAAASAPAPKPKPKANNVWGNLVKERHYRTGHELER